MRSSCLKTCLVSVLSVPLSCLFSPAAQFNSDFNSGGVPPGSSLAGNAVVDTAGGLGNSGVLKLTVNAAGQQGAYYVSDIAGGNSVTNFKVFARVAIGGGTQRPADGMAFAFATDLPIPPGTFGEEGAGSGITVTMDTWDNNGDDTAPSFDVRYGGAILAFQSMATNGPGPQAYREGARDPAGPILLNGAGGPVSLQTFPFAVAPTDGSFVNLVIELFPDNTLSVTWSNVVVFNHLPLPYTPISGGTFAFGARTGGATEAHWIDNLGIFANFVAGPGAILTQPANQSVVESQRATFSVEAGGTPPFLAQWYSNNVAIAGADQLSYTTPPTTTNMNGTVYRVEISNAQNASPVVSGNATLTVIPGLVLISASSRNTATNVFVVFNKPAQRVGTYSLSPAVAVNAVRPGPNPNEVLLETAPLTLDANYILTVTGEKGTDGSTLLPDPSTTRFHYGFGAFCHDFNDNVLPAGTVLSGAASLSGGIVHLTDAAQLGVCGAFWVPDQVAGSPLDRLQARWSSLVGNGVGGGADGYSFNWASDLPSPAGGCYGSEEGAGGGLSVTVDTFDNGGGETGIEIKWRGSRVAFTQVLKDDPGNGVFLRKARFVDASVEVLPNGTAVFNYDGIVISANLPGFAPISGGNFHFVGRTGGASDDQWIDNLRINCFTLGPPVFTLQPVDTTVIEGDNARFTAAVDGAPPLSIQWYTNGVPVPGAITTSYTTPPGAASGLVVSARASNDFGTTSSSNAVFRITPAPRIVSCSMGCQANVIRILYTKPVQLDGSYSTDVTIVNGVSYGSSQSEVLLDVDPVPAETTVTVTIQDVHDLGGFVQFPNPATCVVRYGFGPFCVDFNDNTLPPGTQLLGVATIGGPGANDGILHLTDDGANGVCGGFFIPDQAGGATLDRLHVKFRALIGGVDQAGEAQQFGTGGADGFSFSWGSDVTPTCVGPDGMGNGLIVTVDTFDNGSDGSGLPPNGEAPAIDIKWRGNRVAASYVGNNAAANKAFLRKGSFVDAEVAVFPDGTAQFSYDGVTISAVLPGWAGIAGGKFLFGASTGGAQDNQWIDDLCINNILSGTNGPVLNCPREVVAECTGGLTPVTWTASARDLCEGPVPLTCVPPSGTGFRIGQSNVVCTARNSSGTSSTCTFVVRVADTTPPTLTCPTNRIVEVSSTNGAVINYVAGAFDACGIADFGCSPPPGSTFPLGTNSVTCTASDPSGNTNSCTFVFTVVLPINRAPSFTKGTQILVLGDVGPVTVPAWAKNISPGSPDESGQTLTFLVSNDNTALFSAQPAIDPSGTLTFQVVSGGCGVANVTVVLMDNGGTANGGVDRSPPCVFQIVVQCGNRCPTAHSQSLVTDQNVPLNITLVGTDPENDPLTYLIVSGPTRGTLAGSGANRTYTPNPGTNGLDTFTFAVSDGRCTSAVATVTIDIRAVVGGPTAVIKVSTICDTNPVGTNLVLISPNNVSGCVVLDASMSSDPENDPLTYSWLLDGAVLPFSHAVRVTNCDLAIGTHTIRLIVDDSHSTASATAEVEVVTACDAVEDLIMEVNNAPISRKIKRPLISKLKEACSYFEKGKFDKGVKKLEEFQKKVLAKRDDGSQPGKHEDDKIPAAIADSFIESAQHIIDGVNCVGPDDDDDDDDDDGHH